MAGPLDGIKVLDLTRILAGPWATQLLGDFGADVVKIERPGAGDDTRAWGPPWLGDADRESAYFLAANRNKRSVTVDLSNRRGQQLLRSLAERADVLIENFRPGTLGRFGLATGELAAANPRLIVCTISAYARDSSRAGEPGYDAMIQASGGLMSITGAPDEEGGSPQKVGVAVADIMAGMYAATAILAAVEERHRSGRGQCIEVPLYDAQVAWLANQAMNFLVGGEEPGRRGTAHPNIVPYQTFATADGHVTVAVGNDRQFAALAGSLGLEWLSVDERFATNPARVGNRDALVPILAEALAKRPTGHWLESFAAAGVPAGPVRSIGEALGDDYARERGLVVRLSHALDPQLPTVANPVRFTRTPVWYGAPPPRLGEHTAEVLSEWLGYSAEKIDKLAAASVI